MRKYSRYVSLLSKDLNFERIRMTVKAVHWIESD